MSHRLVVFVLLKRRLATTPNVLGVLNLFKNLNNIKFTCKKWQMANTEINHDLQLKIPNSRVPLIYIGFIKIVYLLKYSDIYIYFF